MSDNLAKIQVVNEYYLCKTKDDKQHVRFVPVSPLDGFVQFIGTGITIDYLSFLTGVQITLENYMEFAKDVRYNVENKLYPTTDHLIMRVVMNGITYLYVSVDNSVRANSAA